MTKLKNYLMYFVFASAPITAFAQDAGTHTLTRADVRQDLEAAEKAGYNPAGPNRYYPASIQAAERREQQMRLTQTNTTRTSQEQASLGVSKGGESTSGGSQPRTQSPVVAGE
jgi:hypothetical protein